jgi:hypothetical protein
VLVTHNLAAFFIWAPKLSTQENSWTTKVTPIHRPGTLVHSVQSAISQLCTSSRIVRRCLSIFQNVYRWRAAIPAFRCAGPVPALRASCCDLQTQVARFLPSLSGVPNQYLIACVRLRLWWHHARIGAYLRNPPLAVASACAALSRTPRSAYTVVGGIWERNATM